MEADDTWDNVNQTNGVMALLELICRSEVQRMTRQDEFDTLIEVMNEALTYCQGSRSDSEYHRVFKDKVASADALGAGIGEQPGRVTQELQDIAGDPNMPTKAERNEATQRVKDKYLAWLFLRNANKKQYGKMNHDIRNDFTMRQHNYPNTLNDAYEYLVNYEPERQGHNEDEGRLAFTQDAKVDSSNVWQRGQRW